MLSAVITCAWLPPPGSYLELQPLSAAGPRLHAPAVKHTTVNCWSRCVCRNKVSALNYQRIHPWNRLITPTGDARSGSPRLMRDIQTTNTEGPAAQIPFNLFVIRRSIDRMSRQRLAHQAGWHDGVRHVQIDWWCWMWDKTVRHSFYF